MPVIATPSGAPVAPCCGAPTATPNLAAVPCGGEAILAAPTSRVRGMPVLSRMQAINLQQGQCAGISWVMRNREGNPVDLSGCLSDGGETGDSSSSALAGSTHVVFRMREAIAGGCNHCRFEAEAEIVNAETGEVRVNLSKEAVALPGVYFGEMALMDDDTDCMRFSNVFYVVVNRGQFGDDTCGGPPTLAEIRLHLRDSNASESFLIDGLAFDDAEIAACIQRPVDYWNEMPPPTQQYTTRTFPFRYFWLEAICANLFLIAAEGYRKNNLKYSAAGVAVDDMDKQVPYDQASERRMAAWREFVRVKKISLNLQAGFGGVSSPYGRRTYW